MVRYEKRYFTGGEYKDYFDFPCHFERAVHLIKITNPRSVLEVGCAYGYTVRHLLNFGIEAKGCDISKWCEGKALYVIPGLFTRCPAWDLKYADKSFDLIYCEGVLEHIPEKKIEKVFKEFERVGDRFYLQISFPEHEGASEQYGHLTLKPPEWWIERMPMNSWLALTNQGTQYNTAWLFKG